MFNRIKKVNKLAKLKLTGDICIVTEETYYSIDDSMIFYTIFYNGNILKLYDKSLTIIK